MEDRIRKEHEIIENLLTEKQKNWSKEFAETKDGKKIREILENLNSKLPTEDNAIPKLTFNPTYFTCRFYTGYPNLNFVPSLKKEDKNHKLFSEEILKDVEKEIKQILNPLNLKVEFHYWVPTENFNVEILNPLIPETFFDEVKQKLREAGFKE